MQRSSVETKYKWNTDLIYPSAEEFEADFKKAKKLTAAMASFREKMCESAENLYDTLSADTELNLLLSRLYEYAHLNSDVDTSDNYWLALSGKAENLYKEAGEASYFILPNLIKLSDNTLEKWYREFPKLLEFKRNITVARRYKEYTLDDNSEKVLAQIQSCLGSHYTVRGVFSYSDLQFDFIENENGDKVRLTDSNYIPFMYSEKREIRKSAFKTLYKTYSQFANTYAALLNGFVKEKCVKAKLRGFESSLHSGVFSDEVTPEIYNNLINTVSSNMDAIFDYYRLKKASLKLDEMHMYDIYTPLVSGLNKKFTYEQAADIVLDTVKVFGDEYYNVFKDGIFNKRWIDVFPTDNKRGGAYSAGCYGVQPYILLNFNGTLEDVSTLAHEGGHSMHTWLSNKHNSPQQSDYTIFVAEVASTVNELLLAHKLLRESVNSDEKKYVLNQLMENYKSTLYRQTMFAEFEKQIHSLCEEGEILTADLLCDKYYEINKKYFGDTVVLDEEIKYEWERIPHFYYNFYVYKYATCISAASTIVKRIETQGEPYVKKYLDFLSCGGSKSPLDSLKVAEIDMTSPEVIENAVEDFRNVISEYKKLL